MSNDFQKVLDTYLTPQKPKAQPKPKFTASKLEREVIDALSKASQKAEADRAELSRSKTGRKIASTTPMSWRSLPDGALKAPGDLGNPTLEREMYNYDMSVFGVHTLGDPARVPKGMEDKWKARVEYRRKMLKSLPERTGAQGEMNAQAKGPYTQSDLAEATRGMVDPALSRVLIGSSPVFQAWTAITGGKTNNLKSMTDYALATSPTIGTDSDVDLALRAASVPFNDPIGYGRAATGDARTIAELPGWAQVTEAIGNVIPQLAASYATGGGTASSTVAKIGQIIANSALFDLPAYATMAKDSGGVGKAAENMALMIGRTFAPDATPAERTQGGIIIAGLGLGAYGKMAGPKAPKAREPFFIPKADGTQKQRQMALPGRSPESIAESGLQGFESQTQKALPAPEKPKALPRPTKAAEPEKRKQAVARTPANGRAELAGAEETIQTRNGMRVTVSTDRDRTTVRFNDGKVEQRDARIIKEGGRELAVVFLPEDRGPSPWYVLDHETGGLVSRGGSEAGAILKAQWLLSDTPKPKPAKFEPKADQSYQAGDVPDIREGLKPVQKPSATQKEPWQMTREEFRTSTATRTEASRSVSFTEWAKSRGLKVGSDYASDPQFAEYIGRSIFPTSNTTTKSQTGKTNGLRKLVDARTRLLKQWEAETLTIEKQVPLSDTERDAAHVRAMHKREIRKALAEGKTVPAEVLADYPDLAPKPQPKPADGTQPAKVGMEATVNRTAPEKVGPKYYESLSDIDLVRKFNLNKNDTDVNREITKRSEGIKGGTTVWVSRTNKELDAANAAHATAPTKAQAVAKIKGGLKKFGDIDPDGPHKAGAGWVPFTEGQIEGLKMVAEGAWELAKISGKSAMDHAFQTMKSHWSPTMQKWFEDEFERRTTVKPERAANIPTEAVGAPTKKDAVPTPAKEAKAPPTNQKVPPAQASQAYAETLRKNLGLPDITKGKKTLVSMVESSRAKEVDANAASFAREWLNDTKRPITDEETAGLARAMNRLDTDTKRIQNEHMAAIERGDTDGAARLDAQLSIVLDDLNDITRVVHRTGTEWGLSGVARRLQLQNDYSTGGLTYRLSKAVKRKASAAELKEAAGHAQSVADAEIQFNKKVEEAVAARLKGMRSAPRAKGNRIFTEDRYKAAVDRINRAARGEEVRMAAGLDPQAMSDLITIVGYHVESGIRTLPELLRKAKELGLDKADERDVALATHQVLSEMDATRAQVESKKATLATLRKEVKDIVDPSILEKVNAKIAEIDSEPMANHPKEYWQSRYNEVNGLLRELNRGKGIGEDVYARFEDAIQDPEVSKARIALQRRKADAEAWLNAKEWESQSGLRKAYELAVEAVNIPRVVLASGDLSAPGRQGLILLLANPKRSVAAFRDQFRAISKAGAEKVLDGIMTEKRYDLARDAKLAIMDVTHSGLFPTEDQFISRFAGKLPIVAQSDRAYSAFLSRIRMDWFTHMVDALEKSGQPVSLKEAKEIAGFVNIATGRGNLGKFETHGNTLAKLMFSARYNWSRIQYLTGTPIWKSKSKRVQREILKTYGQTALGYAGLAAALTYGLGLSIGNDPTRGDIGRAIEGIRRYDITSGLSQYITLGARLFEGLMGNIRGDEKQIKRGMSFDKGKRLIRGKLTPTLGIATDFSINQGKDMFTGKKMGFWDVARKLLLPIGVSQIIENKMEGKPMSDTAKESTAEFFGIGARTWDTLPGNAPKAKSKTGLQKLQKLESTGRLQKLGL